MGVKAVLIAATACLVAGGAQAGCLSGAAVGGVVGHVAGHHGALGAAAGCAIGHHEAVKNQQRQADQTGASNADQNH